MLYNVLCQTARRNALNLIKKAKLRTVGVVKFLKMYNNPGYGGYYGNMMQGPPMPMNSGMMHNPGINRNSYMDGPKRSMPSNFRMNRMPYMDGMDGPMLDSIRKVHCGELRIRDAGCGVEISGRIQNQRLGRFLSLRDDSGITQLVIPDDRDDLQRRLKNMPLNSFLVLRGMVTARPLKSRNEKMATGDVEVVINNFVSVHPKRKRDDSDSDEDNHKNQTKKCSSNSGGLKLTSEELSRCPTPNVIRHFSQRTHTTSDLNKQLVGKTISLCGWVNAKRVGRFVVLKDGYGSVQIVPNGQNASLAQKFPNLHLDSIVVVKGIVSRRPPGHENPRVENGNIEILVEDLTVINPHDPKPPGDEDDGDPPDDRIRKEDSPPSEDLDESTFVQANTNKYADRTHTCGELNESSVGQNVRLVGWLCFSRLNKFALLRDGYGETQLIIPDAKKDLQKLLEETSLESCLYAEGVVVSRPPGQENLKQITGRIEVSITDLKVLNQSVSNLPFNIKDFYVPNETIRLEYRYLDFRFKAMQYNLRMRSKIIHKMRRFLIEHLDFVEVETPTLFKRTPGGAREFVVPTKNKNEFYSLVQSPQQFKQLLMVGSIDRYFQIARCYRDEQGTKDRQPEFTQLDIELSFCDREGIINLIEELLQYCWPENVTQLNLPFPRITYDEAMNLYGTDKPDLRFDWKISNLSNIFLEQKDNCKGKIDITQFIESENFGSYAFVGRKGANKFNRTCRKKFQEEAKEFQPNSSPYFFNVKDKEEIRQKLGELFNSTIADQILETTFCESGDVLFIGFGPKKETLKMLGKTRVAFADFLEENKIDVIQKDAFNFVWIVDFPLFEKNEENLESAHHPFTRPHPDDVELLDTEPLKMRGLHYDLVLNGNEVGGGSLRIHESELQKKILENVLKIESSSLSHLLKALEFGAPPHGGIALGLDRLIAIICNAQSIRDVIAFPKSTSGKDLMSGAPNDVSDEEKKYYHLISSISENIKQEI